MTCDLKKDRHLADMASMRPTVRSAVPLACGVVSCGHHMVDAFLCVRETSPRMAR